MALPAPIIETFAQITMELYAAVDFNSNAIIHYILSDSIYRDRFNKFLNVYC